MCRNVFARALLHGLCVDDDAVDAASELPSYAAGAGDDDKVVQHRARVAKALDS